MIRPTFFSWVDNWSILVLFFAVGYASIVSAGIPITIDRDRLSGISDDSPLARSDDMEGWNYLFDVLRDADSGEIAGNPFESVGFIELNRQPVEYRGRLVRIAGRLLRCEFFPAQQAGREKGYYRTWILLPDQPRIPVCVCVLELPDGFPVGDGLSEQVAVFGFFYKRQLYLSTDDEEVTTPTILAKNLQWTPKSEINATRERERQSTERTRWRFFGGLALLVILWITMRLFVPILRRKRTDRDRIRFDFSRSSGTDEPEFDGKIVIPGFTDRTDQETPEKNGERDEPGGVLPMLGALFLALAGLSAPEVLSAQETKPIDAEFTREFLLEMDEFSWDALGDERIPISQQREPVLNMLQRLQRLVPTSFLEQSVAQTFDADSRSSLSDLVGDPARFRGRVVRLRGRVVHVRAVSLNPAEQRLLGIPEVYLCRFAVSEQKAQAEILTAFVPSAWKRDQPIREPAEATAIYIKRISVGEREESPANESPEWEVDGIGEGLWTENAGLLPLLVAPRIRWYPNTFLGGLGMDVGCLEQIPPLRIADLKQERFDLPPSLKLLGRNTIVLRAFKLTEADREPFYGLLRATKLTPPGRIEQEARKLAEEAGETKMPVVRLFNDPAGTRGQPVLLTGVAKRVMTTLVEDKEVRALYGIDRYYQIYLYTDDSQGHPLVVCVTSLPEGMPIGTNPDYAERITIGAIPYKLWVYETSAELDGGDGYKPSYAPLLIGCRPYWYPKETLAAPLWGERFPEEVKMALSFGLCLLLFGVWFFFRRVKRGKPIEFKLGKK